MEKIKDIIKEILTKADKYETNYLTNEQAVRTQLIEPILDTLGWDTSNPEYVKPNAPGDDGKIPDYTLTKNNKPALIVEAKNLSVNLQDKKIINQLAEYCYNYGIDFGILTNGLKWLLFETYEKNPSDRIVWEVDFENDNIDFVSKNLNSFAFDNIDKLDTLLKKSKTLDENWNKLFKTIDGIVFTLSEKLLKEIKKSNRSFKIDKKDLNSYVKDRFFGLLELNEIEEDNNEEEKENENGNDIEDIVFNRRRKKKARTKLKITFPDNTVFQENKVVDTFIKTVKKIGPKKIIPLDIYRSGVPLVSETKDDVYNQHKIGKYWIMVHTSTKEKKAILEEINNELKLGLKIETFKK